MVVGRTDPAGTPFSKVRLGYVVAIDATTWTCTAQIGDQVATVPGIPILAGVQPVLSWAGQFLEVSAGGGKTEYTLIGMLMQAPGTVRLRKTSAQTVTNSAVLTADTDLKFYALAGRTYLFDALLFARQNSTVATLDFAMGWLMPAGATWTGGGSGPDSAVIAGNASQESANGNYRGLVAQPATAKLPFGLEPVVTGGVYDFKISTIMVSGSIKMSSTSGMCSLAWCQNVAAGASVEVQEGSSLKVDMTSEYTL